MHVLLLIKNISLKCSSKRQSFQLGETLLGVITDWSDAEINGLKVAVGKHMAEQLLRGCTVHCQRSCQHIAERVSSQAHKQRERSVFLKLQTALQNYKALLILWHVLKHCVVLIL